MLRVRISRRALLPDPIRLARYEKAPELGPRILFFSGGTALNSLSRRLLRYTHNSIHIVTPFDSGGSSAKLRDAFHMPAVGDLRSRIMALADQSVKGNPEVVRLFAFRFPTNESSEGCRGRLDALVRGRDSLLAAIPRPMRDLIRTHLEVFRSHMPEGFDLRGASVGNLILAGGYLHHGRDIDPVIFLFSRLVEARGTVVPVTSTVLHLGAEFPDGRRIIGQHLLTGKECPPIAAPIQRIFLCGASLPFDEMKVDAAPEVCHFIGQADLIVFPMGSFFTSILANLLPNGVAAAIRDNDCPKVYVPNAGCDPEQCGMTLRGCIARLLEILKTGCGGATAEQLLNFVLLDPRKECYAPGFDEGNGSSVEPVEIIRLNLLASRGIPYWDEDLVLSVLLSLT